MLHVALLNSELYVILVRVRALDEQEDHRLRGLELVTN